MMTKPDLSAVAHVDAIHHELRMAARRYAAACAATDHWRVNDKYPNERHKAAWDERQAALTALTRAAMELPTPRPRWLDDAAPWPPPRPDDDPKPILPRPLLDECSACGKQFRNGDTCGMGGCPMGGDF